MRQVILRYSSKHFATIAEIDTRYNKMLNEAKKAYSRSRPGFDPDESEEWKVIAADVEEQRQHELAVMRSSLE